VPVIFHGIVTGYPAHVLEAEHGCQVQLGVERPVGGDGLCRRYTEALVEARQEIHENTVGLVHGAGTCETEFGHQPVLEGPACSLYPSLRLGAPGKDLVHSQFSKCPAKLGRLSLSVHRPLRYWGITGMLKYSVTISVHRQGNTSMPDDSLYQAEVAMGILIFSEQGERDGTGSIIHRQE